MEAATPQIDAPAAENQQPGLPVSSGLEEILAQHREWIESKGTAGKQADLSHAHLKGADLAGTNLRDALLNHAILKGSDLLLADLQGASLIQANLQDTNLLGTRLHGANLQGATLDGATGLLRGQLAGTNLLAAVLPPAISISEGVEHVAAVSRRARWLLASMLTLNGLVWLRVGTTRDVQLLKNAPAVPLPFLQTILPFIPFYLFGPMLLLGMFLFFHLYIQRFWEGVAALPAILPEGQRLDEGMPWFATWAARNSFKWLRETRSPLSALEAAISMLVLYWMVPFTLVFLWGRYLTMQDLRGSLFQLLLVMASTATALYFPGIVRRTFEADPLQSASSRRVPTKKETITGVAVISGLGLALGLLSLGTILGMPHRGSRPAQIGVMGIREWAADAFWLIDYSPYAEFPESDVSTRPANWTGREEDFAQVQGARLNRRSLRYVQAYGAFLVRAHLWQADLRHGWLTDADLREANLREADLQSAVLDRARLNRAILQQADLQGANLTQADLRGADLSFATLAGAILPDSRLDGANLYGSDLRNARFRRASLEQADLRETKLQGIDLTLANLSEAFLDFSKLTGAKLREAQLVRAMLMEADLRGADLGGANLQGAILRGADLSGASLLGADLRGAQGLNAPQICKAINLRQTQLDETLLHDVDSTCGLNR